MPRHARWLLLALGLLALAGCGGGTPDPTPPAPAASPCDRAGSSSTAAADCLATGVASLDPAFSSTFEPKRAGQPACEANAQIVFYTQNDWLRLGQKLAADPYECAEYFISIPPTEDEDGLFTVPNAGEAERIRALGPRFRALAEFRVDAWTEWREKHPGQRWDEIGAEFRKRMEQAGYDTAAGDLWAVNELPLAPLTDEAAREDMIELVEGLAGDGAERVEGLVFVVSPEQDAEDVPSYGDGVRSLLRDDGFWRSISRTTRFWAQEVYADPGNCCVAGASDAERVSRLNAYLMYVRTLADRDPEATAARAYLEDAYVPLGNAAWSWTAAYGDTAISADDMSRFVAQQIEAMRAPRADGRLARSVGFAWAPLRPPATSEAAFVEQTGTVLDRIARSLARSFRADEPGAACAEVGCACVVEGASFNDAWSSAGG